MAQATRRAAGMDRMVGSQAENSGGAANLSGDELTRNLRESRPRLADDLVFAPLVHNDETVYHIESTASGQFFRVGAIEYVFLSLFDGNTTFSEALAITAQRMGADALSESQAMHVMTWLIQHQLVEGTGVPVAKSEPKKQGLKRFNPFFNKISFGSPDDFFAAAAAGLGWVFHPISVCVGLGVMLLATGMLIENFDRFSAGSAQVFAPSNWLWLTLTWILLKMVHELGHGVSCKRMGGNVSDVGVMLILCAPLAFVDVTSSWRFASKWKRIGVALAGMYVELFVAAIAVIGWCYTNSPLTEQLLYNVIITATVATVLFNANPLMRFDGYYVLSDLTNTPNLSADGKAAFSDVCRWVFFGTKKSTSTDEISIRSRFVRGYGILATGWQVLITASIGLAAAAMFEKAGLVAVALAGLLYAAQKIKSIWDSVGRNYRQRPQSCLRAGIVTSVLALSAWGMWSWMPNPWALTAPGILQYEDAAVVRAESGGFVRKILVKDGQSVSAGQPLLELDNPDLIAECDAIAAELDETRAREAIEMDEGAIASLQVVAKKRQTLERRLADKVQQRDRLIVTAPIGGHVVARQLAQSIGTYVDIGQEIVSIGDESRKEVILSLRSKEIDDALRRVGEDVQVRLGSNRSVTAKLVRIHPRATLELPHAALAATEGGSLPVKESADSGSSDSAVDAMELIEPRFTAQVRLEPEDALTLACGQRGYARLGLRSETFGRWLVSATRDWLEAHFTERS